VHDDKYHPQAMILEQGHGIALADAPQIFVLELRQQRGDIEC
jgi:hypothetical protein